MSKYYQYNREDSADIIGDGALYKYFRKDLGWGRSYQTEVVFDFLLEASRFCAKGVILDAGAGHQRYRPFFSDSLYLSQEHEDGIKFKDMKGLEYDLLKPIDVSIPLKDNCVDGVLSTSVIEHLLRPDIFCHEAHRVLKPGGKLFINVPFSIIEHERPFDYNRPTRYALKKWLSDAGFKNIIIKPSSSCIETVCNVLPIVAYCDVLKTDQGYEKNFIAVSKSKHSFIVKLYLYLKIVYAAVVYVTTKLYCSLLKLLIDRGPYEKALLPAGWIAVATKSGKLDRGSKIPQRPAFLLKNKL